TGGSWNQLLTIDTGRQRFVTDAVVHCNAITQGFFDTLGVQVVAGRGFGDADENPSLAWPGEGRSRFHAAVVNESLARRYFGGRSPIGSRLSLDSGPDAKSAIEIVGVVRTFSYRNIRDTEDQVFFPFFQGPVTGARFWIRTRTAATAAFGPIRAAVRAIGVVVAVPIVWSSGRLIESQLFGVHATDWRTLVGAAALVAGVALVASALPAWRATAISPIQALRVE